MPKFKTNTSDRGDSLSPERRCSRLNGALSPSRNSNPTMLQQIKTSNSQERLKYNGSAGKMLLYNTSGDLMMKSQVDREDDNRYKRASIMKKVAPGDIKTLFNGMNRGRNRPGVTGVSFGIIGNSSNIFKTQKYQHCQKDPIIIRGNSNVHPNHMVYRQNKKKA